MADPLIEDITAFRNFKGRHKITRLILHPHPSIEDNLDFFTAIYFLTPKLVGGTVFSHVVTEGDYGRGLWPIITHNGIYLSKLQGGGDETLKLITHYKKQRDISLEKLSKDSFVKNAPPHLIVHEKKKLNDFTKMWGWATEGFMYCS
jgi:hypothetical protein